MKKDIQLKLKKLNKKNTIVEALQFTEKENSKNES